MLKVAVKGLVTRRLRAVLTALAIVLGVALVAGTYVLTDSLHADLGSVYQTIYKNTAASITGRNAIDTGANAANGGDVPTFPETLLARVKRLPGVAEASGGVSGTRAARAQRQDGVVRLQPDARLQRRPVRPPAELAEARLRPLAGRDRARRRHQHRLQEAPEGRPADRRPGRRPGAAPADLRDRQVRLGQLARRHDADRLHAGRPRSGCSPSPVSWTRSTSPPRAGPARSSWSTRSSRSSRATPRSAPAPAGADRHQLARQLAGLPEHAAAGVRRDRAVRRRVRDRQLAVDHDRAAHA